MSETTVLGLDHEKEPEYITKFKNAHGFEPVIWEALVRKYIPNPLLPSIFDDAITKIWRGKDIPEHHRACLLMTFDSHYVKKEDYARAASDLRKFLVDFPKQKNRVNHLADIASIFESNPDYYAIGFYCSLGENLFIVDDEETDSCLLPDWSTMFDVYVGVDEISKGINNE